MQTDAQSSAWLIRADKIHYEDVPLDAPFSFGGYRVTKDEIIEFATQFDPQPMHLDEEAAKLTLVGGLCASGWHTCAVFMRIIFDGWLANSTSLGAPGIEEVRWTRPVRPDDVLSVHGRCTEKRLLKSRPGVGICRMKYDVLNQAGERVMALENMQLMRTRGTAVPA